MLRNMPADIADRSAPLRVEQSSAGVGGPFVLASCLVDGRKVTVRYTASGQRRIAHVRIDVENDRRGDFDFAECLTDLDCADEIEWVQEVALKAWQDDYAEVRMPRTVRTGRVTMDELEREAWLKLADDGDAWRGESVHESNPHVCRTEHCCASDVTLELGVGL